MSYYPYYSAYPYYSPYYYSGLYGLNGLYNNYKLNGLLNEYNELNDVAAQSNAAYIQNLINDHRDFHVDVVYGKDKEIENLHNELKKHDIAIPEFKHDASMNAFDISMNKEHDQAKEKRIWGHYPKPYWPRPRPHWPYPWPHWPHPRPHWPHHGSPYLYRDAPPPVENSPPAHPHMVIPHAVSPHVVTKFLPNTIPYELSPATSLTPAPSPAPSA